jgi:1,2-phenylacetyl-CoA epoxidase catalytic subunit
MQPVVRTVIGLGLVGITLTGVLLSLSRPEGQILAFAQVQSADQIDADQIELFAQIVLDMEPHRLEAQAQSENTTDPDTKDQIRREFIRKATEIITTHGMTVPDYNRITLLIRAEEGQSLRQDIEAQIRQLQESGYEPGTLGSVPTPE